MMNNHDNDIVRPAGVGAPAPYAIYHFIEANRAERIFYGTAPECYAELNRLRTEQIKGGER